MRSTDRAMRFKAHQLPLESFKVERAMPIALMFAGYSQGLSYIQKWAEENGLCVDEFLEKVANFEIQLLCGNADDWRVFDSAEPMQLVPGDYETLFHDYCSGMHCAVSDFKSWSAGQGINATPIIHAMYQFLRDEGDSLLSGKKFTESCR